LENAISRELWKKYHEEQANEKKDKDRKNDAKDK
jgi:hypothetical protein